MTSICMSVGTAVRNLNVKRLIELNIASGKIPSYLVGIYKVM